MKELNKDDVDKLPRKLGFGANCNKELIDWANCIGKKIRFIYRDITGEVELINYDTKTSKLCIRYLNKEPFKINTNSFIECRLGKLLGEHTNEFKIEIDTKFKDDKRNLIIIDREYRNRSDAVWKYYKYKCLKCGYNEGWTTESALLNNVGCACCGYNSKVIVQGINDIPTTAPWMVKYFQGGYDEAKLYSKCNTTKINPICPDCKKVRNKKMKISDIYSRKSIACSCGDGLSYPEKIMFSLLEQLNIPFIIQLNKTTFKWCSNYRYDFYIPYVKCIIETHGIQHYLKDSMNRTLIQEQENDKLKEKLAKENEIENYIVIDCRYSELEWIKDNIYNSKLNELFDLSKVDWDICQDFSLSNLVKKACELKQNDINLTTLEIGEIMKLDKTTIINYLKKGAKIGWCNYDGKEEMRKGSSRVGKLNGKLVEVFKDGISQGVFNNCKELERQSKEIFGVKLFQGEISSICRGYRKQHKGFTFKYV